MSPTRGKRRRSDSSSSSSSSNSDSSTSSNNNKKNKHSTDGDSGSSGSNKHITKVRVNSSKEESKERHNKKKSNSHVPTGKDVAVASEGNYKKRNSDEYDKYGEKNERHNEKRDRHYEKTNKNNGKSDRFNENNNRHRRSEDDRYRKNENRYEEEKSHTDDENRHYRRDNGDDRRNIDRSSNRRQNDRRDFYKGERHRRDDYEGEYSKERRRSPARDRRDNRKYRRNRSRSRSFDQSNPVWGKMDQPKSNQDAKSTGDKQKPNFGLSGKLTEETNTYKGVVVKYSEPPEARKAKRRWRLYPFKGEKLLQILYIHRESAYLIGRERKVVDLPVDHPSCSKQHAALQYRLVPFTREDGSSGKRVRPYIIDLDSANGTFINNQKIEPRKYVELFEKDVIKFGFSSREYVLVHENSKNEAQDDDVKLEEEAEVKIKVENESNE